MDDKEKKVPKDKPVFRFPLDYFEALVALLGIKPKPSAQPKETEKNKTDKPSSHGS